MPTERDLVARLTHRSAWLSLAAALFFFVGLLTSGTAAQKTEDVALRAASGAPFGVAVGGAIWARATRARLRALRRDAEVEDEATGGAGVAGASVLAGGATPPASLRAALAERLHPAVADRRGGALRGEECDESLRGFDLLRPRHDRS